MLRFLFGRLTGRPRPAAALFERIVAEARRPHWFVAGEVPDTLNGRFAVLATVCALVIVRLESGTEATQHESAGLTERFVEAMDAEHRQMGMNDPALGKRVRTLVGSLAHRVEQWREPVAGNRDWNEIAKSSIYGAADASAQALEHSATAVRQLWARLESASDRQLVEGQF